MCKVYKGIGLAKNVSFDDGDSVRALSEQVKFVLRRAGVLPRAHIYGVCVKCIKITGDVQGRVQDLGLKMEMVFVQRSASLLSMKL